VRPGVGVTLPGHFDRSVEVLSLTLVMDVVETTDGHMELLLPVFDRLKMFLWRRKSSLNFAFREILDGNSRLVVQFHEVPFGLYGGSVELLSGSSLLYINNAGKSMGTGASIRELEVIVPSLASLFVKVLPVERVENGVSLAVCNVPSVVPTLRSRPCSVALSSRPVDHWASHLFIE